jgi:hypothetical protein
MSAPTPDDLALYLQTPAAQKLPLWQLRRIVIMREEHGEPLDARDYEVLAMMIRALPTPDHERPRS